MDPVAILAVELRRVHGVVLSRNEVAALLQNAGLTLTGGAKQAAEAHLAQVGRLGGAG
jgi:hypothetical protein